MCFAVPTGNRLTQPLVGRDAPHGLFYESNFDASVGHVHLVALVPRAHPRQAVHPVPREPSGFGENHRPIYRGLLHKTGEMHGAVRCNGDEGTGQRVRYTYTGGNNRVG